MISGMSRCRIAIENIRAVAAEPGVRLELVKRGLPIPVAAPSPGWRDGSLGYGSATRGAYEVAKLKRTSWRACIRTVVRQRRRRKRPGGRLEKR